MVVALLSITSSCSGEVDASEDGTPAEIEIRGTVTDGKEPIKGIKVSFAGTNISTSTGIYGYFVIYRTTFINQGDEIVLRFEDIDGDDNGGSFTTREITHIVSRPIVDDRYQIELQDDIVLNRIN